jgi:hypothetical protein
VMFTGNINVYRLDERNDDLGYVTLDLFTQSSNCALIFTIKHYLCPALSTIVSVTMRPYYCHALTFHLQPTRVC